MTNAFFFIRLDRPCLTSLLDRIVAHECNQYILVIERNFVTLSATRAHCGMQCKHVPFSKFSCLTQCADVTVDSWKPIADYVEQQFEQFYQDETGLDRHNIKDTRVHCCLYFIPPYGRG